MAESALRTFLLHRESVIGTPAVGAGAGARALRAGRLLRTGLMAGGGISLCIAWYLGDPISYISADPPLARLLRGMALIKGMLATAALAAVWWRFGRPVSNAVAAGYLLGSWVLVGSTTLIWQLSWIPAAAVLFHVAGLSMLFMSWRER